MGLLFKRPLALFCTCFLIALYASIYVVTSAKILFTLAFLLFAVLGGLLVIWNKKKRMLWITLALCMLVMAFSVLHVYFRIDRPKEAALSAAEQLAKAGVRGIWNFSDTELDLHIDGVLIENMHLADALMGLCYAMHTEDELMRLKAGEANE